jgi:hypothetical protein
MNFKNLLFVLLAGLLIASCSDDEAFNCKSCADEPEALAANDNSGKGIYKGVVVGSSGNIKFNIANGGSSITATLKIDGVTIQLTTEATYSNDYGFEGYFYGTLNEPDDVQVGFYVDQSGLQYGFFGIVIPGHDNVDMHLIKEKSDALIAVYEGTFSGDASGTFNIVLSRELGLWVAIAKNSNSQEILDFEGTLNSSSLVCDCDEIVVTGKVSGDEISGRWEDTIEGDSGSWKGRRTL